MTLTLTWLTAAAYSWQGIVFSLHCVGCIGGEVVVGLSDLLMGLLFAVILTVNQIHCNNGESAHANPNSFSSLASYYAQAIKCSYGPTADYPKSAYWKDLDHSAWHGCVLGTESDGHTEVQNCASGAEALYALSKAVDMAGLLFSLF